MTRYDYDFGFQPRRRLSRDESRFYAFDESRPYRLRRRWGPPEGYIDDLGEFRPMGAIEPEVERMGMHDFSEQYGRYSGGSPYSYEYSERTVPHRSRYHGVRGFSHPLGPDWYERSMRPRAPRSAREYWLRRGRW